MGWRKPTIDDLAATLSQDELDAFQGSAPYSGADPAAAILARTCELVRGYCRANGSCVMSKIPGEIPESLIAAAMDYAAYDLLKRMPVKIGDDRRKARESAEALLRDVAANKFKPEPPESNPAADISEDSKTAGSPACAPVDPRRLLD